MAVLSFFANLHRWVKRLWSVLGGGILVSVLTAFVYDYATTGSVALDPALFNFLAEHTAALGIGTLALLLLTGATYWAKRRQQAYEAFRTIKQGGNLTSPNEIAYAPVYASEETESGTAGRDLRQRPFKNEYVPLPLLKREESKRRGIEEAVAHTDAEISTRLQEGDYVVLIGAPTAGKTRKAFEILRGDLATRYVLVPKLETLGEGLPPEAKQFLSGREVTVVLDDLNQYASDGQALREYLRAIEESAASCSVLGTCRDGPELERARDRREGEPLSASGIEEVYRLFSENQYLVKPPSAEQSREIMEGADIDPSSLNLIEQNTPGDLLLEQSKREMQDRFEKDLSRNQQDLLHAAQLLDEANVKIIHQRLRRAVQEAFGRDRFGSEGAFRDALDRLERLGFIAPPLCRDPVVLERAYTDLEKGVVPYPAGRAVQEDLENLISILSAGKDAEGLVQLGSYFHNQQDYALVVESLNQALEIDPSFVEARNAQGVALAQQGNLEAAIDSYDQAIEADPSCARAWVNRGVALAEQGNLNDAIDSFDQAIETEPSQATAWYNRIIALVEQGDLEGVIESYDQALEIDPSDAEEWINRGFELVEQGDLERAIDSYDQAIEINPSLAEAWINRGSALAQQGNFERAVDNFYQAIEIDPSYAKAWYNRGTAWFEMGKPMQAIESFHKALEIDASYVKAWYNLGTARFEIAELESAVATYDRALEIDSTLAKAWYMRGVALYTVGKEDRATRSIYKACELDSMYCGPYPWEDNDES